MARPHYRTIGEVVDVQISRFYFLKMGSFLAVSCSQLQLQVCLFGFKETVTPHWQDSAALSDSLIFCVHLAGNE